MGEEKPLAEPAAKFRSRIGNGIWKGDSTTVLEGCPETFCGDGKSRMAKKTAGKPAAVKLAISKSEHQSRFYGTVACAARREIIRISSSGRAWQMGNKKKGHRVEVAGSSFFTREETPSKANSPSSGRQGAAQQAMRHC